MEKFVEYKKMSKKKQREYNNSVRGSFGAQPYTVSHKSAKDYNRKAEKLKIRKELERAEGRSGSYFFAFQKSSSPFLRKSGTVFEKNRP